MKIEITSLEALMIDAHCKNQELAEDTFLQLGQVILNGGVRVVEFTEDDLWKIREAIPFSTRIENEQVGMNIKRKIYKALTNLQIQRETGFSVLETDEQGQQRSLDWKHPDYNDMVEGKEKELNEWKSPDLEDKDASGDTSKDSNKDTGEEDITYPGAVTPYGP